MSNGEHTPETDHVRALASSITVARTMSACCLHGLTSNPSPTVETPDGMAAAGSRDVSALEAS
eukprot:34892-Eustigmatos_ZCMA.PRE.1